jgi:hypothetical protein
MPWTSRPSRKRRTRLQSSLRRWRYDHSETFRAFLIGAAVVGLAAAVIVAVRLAG